MATQAGVKTAPASNQPADFEQKVEKLREIYADASEVSKTALENVIRSLGSGVPANASEKKAGSAGRIGAREGKVSELTIIAPLRKGGAKRLRAFFETLHGSIGNQSVDKVGTVHDMRFVFLDNDTKLLFASTYDGDWDAYIDDFATKIPDILDLQFGEIDGWPGVRKPAGERLHRQAPGPGGRLVRRQSEFDRGGDKTGGEGRQGSRRIPRQGELSSGSERNRGGRCSSPAASGSTIWCPILRSVRCLRWKTAVDRT